MYDPLEMGQDLLGNLIGYLSFSYTQDVINADGAGSTGMDWSRTIVSLGGYVPDFDG